MRTESTTKVATDVLIFSMTVKSISDLFDAGRKLDDQTSE